MKVEQFIDKVIALKAYQKTVSKINEQPETVMYIRNLSTPQAEVEGQRRAEGQPRLHSKFMAA